MAVCGEITVHSRTESTRIEPPPTRLTKPEGVMTETHHPHVSAHPRVLLQLAQQALDPELLGGADEVNGVRPGEASLRDPPPHPCL